MIRYSKTLTEIQARIDTDIPNWHSRAKRRTNKLIKLGHYEEKTEIWGEVKPIFMHIQHNKCVYCEQQLEGGKLGAIAHDLEHFRPKNSVRVWPEDVAVYPFATGDALVGGYYRLAYHPGNYLTACKVCNTMLKSNYFPIRAARVEGKDTPLEYAAERPFLIYPIQDTNDDPDEDDNPENIIAFRGVEALPRHSAGEKWQRAVVIIDFLKLNRDDLQTSRAYTLIAVWEAFKNVERKDAHSQAVLNLLTSERAPHTSCARYFQDLCWLDRNVAAATASECLNLIRRNNT